MELQNNFPHDGKVEWIGLRPERRARLEPVHSVEARKDRGLEGDHFSGKPGSKRQVTIVQHEHLAVVASLSGLGSVDPGMLRRNISISGINVLSLVDRRFRIGGAEFEGSGACHPCSRMEENLGRGGWNAMRGHGGITARVVASGHFSVGDPVADMGPAGTATARSSES